MTPPRAPIPYDAGAMQQALNVLAKADDQSLKRDRDVEVGSGRLILRAPNGARYVIAVTNTGALVATGI